MSVVQIFIAFHEKKSYLSNKIGTQFIHKVFFVLLAYAIARHSLKTSRVLHKQFFIVEAMIQKISIRLPRGFIAYSRACQNYPLANKSVVLMR